MKIYEGTKQKSHKPELQNQARENIIIQNYRDWEKYPKADLQNH